MLVNSSAIPKTEEAGIICKTTLLTQVKSKQIKVSTNIPLLNSTMYFLQQKLGILKVLFQVDGLSNKNGRMLIRTVKQNSFNASG
jgi:hypothetical protein